MKFARGIAAVLALAVVGTGCARLNPNVSDEYKASAAEACKRLKDYDYLIELQKKWGDDGMGSELGTQLVRAGGDSRRALNAATRARRTWGDRRLHKQLASYAVAQAEEELAILAAGDGLKKPWKPELAARLAEKETKKREARQRACASEESTHP